MQPKINIPTDERAMKDLLKDLLAGRKKPEDLIEDTIEIRLNTNPSDEDRQAFAANRELQDNWKGDPATLYFTIEL